MYSAGIAGCGLRAIWNSSVTFISYLEETETFSNIQIAHNSFTVRVVATEWSTS